MVTMITMVTRVTMVTVVTKLLWLLTHYPQLYVAPPVLSPTLYAKDPLHY